MCESGKCEGVCPAAKANHTEKPCGKTPEQWETTLFGLFLREGEFLPPVMRAANGQLIGEREAAL